MNQESLDGTPFAFYNNGIMKRICNNEITNGIHLYSNTQMTNQGSCIPLVGSSGNFYSWPASTASGDKNEGHENNSICAKGWSLTTNESDNKKSYYYLITFSYGLLGNIRDESIRLLPMSFVRAGYYGENSIKNQENLGYYWSSAIVSASTAFYLRFDNGTVNTQENGSSYSYDHYFNYKKYGMNVRCVAR